MTDSEDMSLVVTDRRTGRPVAIPISSIPPEIRPDNWFDNAYWRHRPDRGDLEPMIQALYSQDFLGPRSIQVLAQYIVDYACHIAVAAYIFGGGPESLEFNVECIKKLRELKASAKHKRDIREMIRVGMNYALDPF